MQHSRFLGVRRENLYLLMQCAVHVPVCSFVEVILTIQ